MSSSPDSELDLDLQFLPAWATKSPTDNPYTKFEGRSDKGGGKNAKKKPFQKGGRPGDRPDRRPPRGRKDNRRGQPMPRQRELPPLPEIAVTFIPESKGVDSLVRQIKLTGRAYPMFDIARLVLKKPERFILRLETVKKPEGGVAHPIWLCNLDNSIWLREQDAMDHVLKKHFDVFYQTEKIPSDPPKGTYTFVAQCGYSQTILGPPNYHDYQNKLRQLHKERFSHIPFEAYKSRVKIVKDEEVVKKWVEDQSYTTEYTCLNVPEPLKLDSFEAVQKHFRETHLSNIVKQTDEFEIHRIGDRDRLPGPLKALVKKTWEEQKRYPLKVVTQLSQQFAAHALQFFKVDKTVTHVSVARPHYLDLDVTPVSDGVRKIVKFIDETPRCTRKLLLESLADVPVVDPPEPKGGAETATKAEAEPPSQKEPTPAQAAIISDLHWLIHQGHVIEYSTGIMEIAAKPKPQAKPKPAKKAEPKAEAKSEPAQTTPSKPQTEAAQKPESADAPPQPTAESVAASESPSQPAAEQTPSVDAPSNAPSPAPAESPDSVASESASESGPEPKSEPPESPKDSDEPEKPPVCETPNPESEQPAEDRKDETKSPPPSDSPAS